MRRGAKPAKANAESTRPVARKSGKGEGSRGGDLEKRLAETLERVTADWPGAGAAGCDERDSARHQQLPD